MPVCSCGVTERRLPAWPAAGFIELQVWLLTPAAFAVQYYQTK